MLRVTHADARLRRAARGDAPCSGEVEFLVLLTFIMENPQSPGICNRSKSVGTCINHYNSYVDRLSSEKNPVNKSKPPLSRRWWEEMHITTTHTSIAFLQRRRIPSIRINHNFKQPQIHNATAHIINHPQHSSHWQFQ